MSSLLLLLSDFAVVVFLFYWYVIVCVSLAVFTKPHKSLLPCEDIINGLNTQFKHYEPKRTIAMDIM